MREFNLYIKLAKSVFFAHSVQYLGHNISSSGIRTCSDLTDKVADWPTPKNAKEVERFLGLANYYSRFVYRYANIAAPLNELTKSTVEWKWGEAENEAFTALKTALCSDPVLKPFDPALDTLIETDASQTNLAVGAVLVQRHKDGLHPVAYFSHKLSASERNYTVHDLEGLAIVLALKRWRHYVSSKRIPVYTDHAGLKHLLQQPHLNLRQVRWLTTLSEFDLTVHYKPGKENGAADALSRRPHVLKESTTEEVLERQQAVCSSRDIPSAVVNAMLVDSAVSSSFIRQCVEEYPKDAQFAGPYRYLTAKSATYAPSYDHYSLDVESGALRWDDGSGTVRICVPSSLVPVLLHEFHDSLYGGHLASQHVYDRVRKHFYWPHMRKEIGEYTSSCDLCQRVKDLTSKPRMPTVVAPPPFPFHTIMLDFCGPFQKTHPRGYDLILSVQCMLTKRVRFIPCKTDITARGTADLIFDHVVSQHGFPLKVMSDRDSKFLGEFWTRLWSRFGSQLQYSYPYEHRSQGSVERSHRTIEQMLRCYVNRNMTDWDQHLHILEFTMNSTIHPATGYSPFFLDTGREPMVPILAGLGLDTESQSGTAGVRDAVDFARDHQRHLQIARDALLQSRAASADTSSVNVRDPQFKVGDLVLLSTENMVKSRRQRKLRHHWVRPFSVIAVFRNGVELDLSNSNLSSRLSRVWSNTHVKRYRARDQTDTDRTEQDVATAEEFFDEVENDNTSPAESERESESEDDFDTAPSQLPSPQSPSDRTSVRYTPRIVNHLRRGGTVWYYVRKDPGAAPVLCTREQAEQANAEELRHYERLYLGKRD